MESINTVLACDDPCGNIQNPGDFFPSSYNVFLENT